MQECLSPNPDVPSQSSFDRAQNSNVCDTCHKKFEFSRYSSVACSALILSWHQTVAYGLGHLLPHQLVDGSQLLTSSVPVHKSWLTLNRL